MTGLPERAQVMAMVAEAIVGGARQERACEVISLSERTLQRWQNDQAEGAGDRRPARICECNLGSPLREIRTAGSARGDGYKRRSLKVRLYPPSHQSRHPDRPSQEAQSSCENGRLDPIFVICSMSFEPTIT